MMASEGAVRAWAGAVEEVGGATAAPLWVSG